MRTLTTDVAIIGAGTAGLNARREVERAGKHWLLIEAGPYGTTCARTGCMPSKLLIAAGEAAQRAREADLFGIQIAPEAIRIDGQAVLSRVRRERDRFTELTARAVEALPAAQRIRGTARFLSPNELAVDDHTRIVARAIVIATGSAPFVPPELEPAADRLLTSDNVFELPKLPESIAVFGTGAIGLELGQALSQLGVHVAFYNPQDVVGSFTDPVVDGHFREVMAERLELSLGATLVDVRRDDRGVSLRYRDRVGAQHERRFSHVLAAVGRRPQLTTLALEASGLELDPRGVPKFDRHTMQCGESAIFIAGDADTERQIMHEAVHDGCIAGANAARFPKLDRRPLRVAFAIGFTQPQLAMVGQSFKQLAGRDVVIGEASYDDQGRARVNGQNRGHVRLYVDRQSHELLGTELFGPDVEHTAHLLAWSVQQGLTLPRLLGMPVYHPTVEEGIRSALRDAARKLDLLKGCAPEERGEGAGT